MGVAAYNRGSACISRQMQAERRPQEFDVMDTLNILEKYEDAGIPSGQVRLEYSHKVWWVFCPKTGFGFHYKSIHEAVRRWHISIIGCDENGWDAIPTPE